MKSPDICQISFETLCKIQVVRVDMDLPDVHESRGILWDAITQVFVVLCGSMGQT